MRCNNSDDLLHITFTLKVRGLYINQSNIYDGVLLAKIVVKYIHKKVPSQMLAWVLNTPLLFEDSSNV